MDLKEFLEKIETSCSFLEAEGYQLRKVDASVNRNFWYEKNTETGGYRIAFGWTQYGEEFHVKGLHALKRFNEVELQIQKVVGGDLTDYYTIYKAPATDLIPENLPHEATEDNIHFILKNERDISLFADFIKNFYIKTVIDFYNEYLKLNSVNTLLQELLETKKIQSLLTSTDNTTIIRFYVIAIISDNLFVKDFFKNTYFPYLDNNLNNEIKKTEKERLEKINMNLNI